MDIQKLLAVMAPLALVAFMAALLFFDPPPAARDMLNMALGVLAAQSKDVYGFWFGSSLGSRNKDAILGERK